MEMKVRAPVLGVLSNGPASSQPTGEHSNPFATPAIAPVPIGKRRRRPLTPRRKAMASTSKYLFVLFNFLFD